MRTILSYPIELLPPVSEPWATAEVVMPIFSRVLRVDLVRKVPTLVVLTNTDNHRVVHKFAALSEGDQIPDGTSTATYVGGWVDLDVPCSWSLFEVR